MNKKIKKDIILQVRKINYKSKSISLTNKCGNSKYTLKSCSIGY